MSKNDIAILIAVAMPKERHAVMDLLGNEPIEEQLPSLTLWRSVHRPIALIETGIGKVNAALALQQALLSIRPRLVLNIGVSGALHAQVPYGAYVCAERMAYHDVDCGAEIHFGQIQGMPLFFEGDKAFCRAFRTLPLSHSYCGLITSGERFLTAAAQNEVNTYFPDTLAGDMESAAIAHTAYKYATPVAAVRVISDIPSSGDGYAQYLRFWRQDYRPIFAQLSVALLQLFETTNYLDNL